MVKLQLSDAQRSEIEEIYNVLQQGYDRVAAEMEFSCEGCPDNCCDSWFQHHSHVEWLYFREGLAELTEERQAELRSRATDYILACGAAQQRGERPQVDCPLLEDGLCSLYKHRLLVCRTHGVPARMKRPDGKLLRFPGCFRCQEVIRKRYPQGEEFAPTANRTPMLMRLAKLENEVLCNKRHLMEKVQKTIAEMILEEPPELPGF
ncbi:hypothetical protein JWG39_06375 [Desulforhopalus vacuolatus]|nr:hypothetical protein [Desulforhopalus vacuolatus]